MFGPARFSKFSEIFGNRRRDFRNLKIRKLFSENAEFSDSSIFQNFQYLPCFFQCFPRQSRFWTIWIKIDFLMLEIYLAISMLSTAVPFLENLEKTRLFSPGPILRTPPLKSSTIRGPMGCFLIVLHFSL